MATSIRLPKTLAIGFSGHRSLPDEHKSRQIIYDFLKEQKDAAPGLICGISSVASGGDLLFAESCLKLGIPIQVLLPLPEDQFRRDFDEASWLRAQKVLREAISVQVTGGEQSRDERYYECGIETVHRSTLLVALWDGDASRGQGGTQEIVAFARNTGKPIFWFHSATGHLTVLNESTVNAALRDPELETLNSLPDLDAALSSNEPKELAKAWLRKVDENATRLAPNVRRVASISIVCTAIAAICSGAASWAPGVWIWLAIGTAFGAIAAVLPVALNLSKRQVLWAKTRTAAEVCRSFLAFWDAPRPVNAVDPEAVPELAGALASLELLKLSDRSRRGSSPTLDDFKRAYRDGRVDHQIEYFQQHAAQSRRGAQTYRAIVRICTIPAVVVAVGLFIAASRFAGHHSIPERRWLALLVSILFQIATVASALLVVNDCERRRLRYADLSERLKQWGKQIDSLQTWPSVLQVARKVERALLIELVEWRTVVRDVKMPRK